MSRQHLWLPFEAYKLEVKGENFKSRNFHTNSSVLHKYVIVKLKPIEESVISEVENGNIPPHNQCFNKICL